MKITRKQLRRVIQEVMSPGTASLESRLLNVWDNVSADTMEALGGQATWQDIADEVMAVGDSFDPEMMGQINAMDSWAQDRLFKKVFGAGSRY